MDGLSTARNLVKESVVVERRYERLNRILDQPGSMRTSKRCAHTVLCRDDGRPSLAPGRYFRLLLVGYFEGLDSERAIAWRAADSLALRRFMNIELPEAPAGHSTVSRPPRLIDVETYRAVFTWIHAATRRSGFGNREEDWH